MRRFSFIILIALLFSNNIYILTLFVIIIITIIQTPIIRTIPIMDITVHKVVTTGKAQDIITPISWY